MREPAALSQLQIPPGERGRSAGAWAEQSHPRRDPWTDRDLAAGMLSLPRSSQCWRIEVLTVTISAEPVGSAGPGGEQR